METRVETAENWMEKFFVGEEVGNVEERGYRLRIAVAGYTVTPRDDTFEYFRDFGKRMSRSC